MPDNDPLFVTWEPGNADQMNEALAMAGKGLLSSQSIHHTSARTTFRDIEPNISVREGFSRRDYEYFRPNETIPYEIKQIMQSCNVAYFRIGIVRHCIDMMADFICKGIRFEHSNESISRFYTQWAKKIDIGDRSERFVNCLLRMGMTIPKKSTAKIKPSLIRDMKRTIGSPDIEIFNEKNFEKREIPWEYHFLNPMYIEIIGEELASFTGVKKIGLKLPSSIKIAINNPKPGQADLISKLPLDVIAAAKSKSQIYELDQTKVSIHYYKKDDWQNWPYPMLYAILDDLMDLEKLKMADRAALDGAISHVRLWKLGRIFDNGQSPILPTQAAFAKLNEMLLASAAGTSLDLIWGPDIELVETSTDISKFLGSEKYGPVLASIYGGLGIPPTLTGANSSGAFTNNFISLRTLTERLHYVRSVLSNFWANEVAEVHKAMDFPGSPPIVSYDHMILTDEAAEKALLIQMIDRDLISEEMVQKQFGIIPEIEGIRIKRQNRKRKSGKLGPKAGPFYNTQIENELKKIALQRGSVTPSEVGLNLDPKKPGEKSMQEIQEKSLKLKAQQPGPVPTKKKKGVSGQGRPKNSKDSQKRTRTVKIRRGAGTSMWASEAQKTISDILNPLYLSNVQKKNMRSLSDSQFEQVEKLKFHILFNINPFTAISQELIQSILENLNQNTSAYADFKSQENEIMGQLNRALTVEERRNLASLIYADYYSDDNNGVKTPEE